MSNLCVAQRLCPLCVLFFHRGEKEGKRDAEKNSKFTLRSFASLLTLRQQNISISLLYRNVSTNATVRNDNPLRFSAPPLTLRSSFSSRREGEKEMRGEEL